MGEKAPHVPNVLNARNLETLLPPDGEYRRALFWLRERGAISRETQKEGLRRFNVRLDSAGWLDFFYRLLSLMGVLLLTVGVIFFMAWNWHAMHRLIKLGIMLALLLLETACAYKLSGRRAGDLALLAFALTTGAALAVFGQAYQTGADSWELFRAWTLALVPLALFGRQAALWLALLVVANLWRLCSVPEPWAWFTFETRWAGLYWLSQIACLAAWEVLYALQGRHAGNAGGAAGGDTLSQEFLRPFSVRWMPRLLALFPGIALTCLLAGFVWEDPWELVQLARSGYLPIWIFVLWAGTLLVVWRFGARDAAMPSMVIFSLAALLSTALLRPLRDFGMDALFLPALCVAAMAYAALRIIMALRAGERAKKVRAAEKAAKSEAKNAPEAILPRRAVFDWLKTAARLEETDAAPTQPSLEAELDAIFDKQLPWYLRLGVFLGVLLAVCLLGGFLFGTGGDLRSAILITGLLFSTSGLLLAWWNRLMSQKNACQPPSAGGYFALALTLAGGTLLCVYVGFYISFARAGVVALVLALLSPQFPARLLFFFVACIVLYAELMSSVLSVPYNGSGGMACYAAANISLNGIFALAAAIGLRAAADSDSAKSGWSEIILPFGIALFIFACGSVFWLPAQILGLSDNFLRRGAARPLRFGPSWSILTLPGLTVSFFVLASLLPPARRFALRWPQAVGGLLLIACTGFNPGLGLGLTAMLAARALGSLHGIVLSALGLAFYLNLYYYALEVSLLEKSLIIMAGGLVSLAAALAAHRLAVAEGGQK